MSHVHAIAARSASRVHEEWLALLMPVEDQVELPMAKDDAPAHESMRLMAGYSVEPFEELLADEIRPKVPHQLIVVHGKELALLVHSARDIERCDYLLMLCGQAQVCECRWLPGFVCHDDNQLRIPKKEKGQ